MGSSRVEAINAAKQLNSLLVVSHDLVENVLGYVSVADHIQWMRNNILPEREYSKSTLSITETRYRNLISSFGSRNIAGITVKTLPLSVFVKIVGTHWLNSMLLFLHLFLLVYRGLELPRQRVHSSLLL
jgi:hypothetical protein